MEGNIKRMIAEFDKDFKPKRKIVLPQSYIDEFKATKTYKNGQNWANAIKMTNSYAEAKQHNII